MGVGGVSRTGKEKSPEERDWEVSGKRSLQDTLSSLLLAPFLSQAQPKRLHLSLCWPLTGIA